MRTVRGSPYCEAFSQSIFFDQTSRSGGRKRQGKVGLTQRDGIGRWTIFWNFQNWIVHAVFNIIITLHYIATESVLKSRLRIRCSALSELEVIFPHYVGTPFTSYCIHYFSDCWVLVTLHWRSLFGSSTYMYMYFLYQQKAVSLASSPTAPTA